MLVLLLAAFACSDLSDTGEESAPKGATYHEVSAVIPETGAIALYGMGPVYIPMICPAGDLGVCYPAERGPDFAMKDGVLTMTGAPGDVVMVGYFAE